jgi:ABC-type bacteriocin/lantibiotic exporter with double-glycine peptidase domain
VVDKSDDDADVSNSNPTKISTSGIFTASTLLALSISVPAIIVTLVLYYILKTTLALTLLSSLITLFLAMGFSYKISKKLMKVQQKNKNQDARKSP